MFSDNPINEKKLIFPDQLFFLKNHEDVDLNHDTILKEKNINSVGFLLF
jgi:hypothetical protein